MGEKDVGWLVTNESGGRQAKRDGGKGIWLRMWADRINRKQACLHPLLEARHKYLHEAWKRESFRNLDLSMCLHG